MTAEVRIGKAMLFLFLLIYFAFAIVLIGLIAQNPILAGLIVVGLALYNTRRLVG